MIRAAVRFMQQPAMAQMKYYPRPPRRCQLIHNSPKNYDEKFRYFSQVGRLEGNWLFTGQERDVGRISSYTALGILVLQQSVQHPMAAILSCVCVAPSRALKLTATSIAQAAAAAGRAAAA